MLSKHFLFTEVFHDWTLIKKQIPSNSNTSFLQFRLWLCGALRVRDTVTPPTNLVSKTDYGSGG